MNPHRRLAAVISPAFPDVRRRALLPRRSPTSAEAAGPPSFPDVRRSSTSSVTTCASETPGVRHALVPDPPPRGDRRQRRPAAHRPGHRAGAGGEPRTRPGERRADHDRLGLDGRDGRPVGRHDAGARRSPPEGADGRRGVARRRRDDASGLRQPHHGDSRDRGRLGHAARRGLDPCRDGPAARLLVGGVRTHGRRDARGHRDDLARPGLLRPHDGAQHGPHLGLRRPVRPVRLGRDERAPDRHEP
jgi:hypothetical protein